MKAIKYIITTLFLCILLSVSAQCDVECGLNQTIPYNGSVQLNATATQKARWENLSTGSNAAFQCTFFTSANVGYAAGTSATIIKTTDGGDTWTVVNSGSSALVFVAMAFGNDQIGCAVTLTGVIYRTIDAGATWKQVSIGVTTHMRSICFTDENTVYIAGYTGNSSNGMVLKSTDGGATWGKPIAVCPDMLHAVHFTSPTTGYVSGSNNGVYKTTDGGANWTLTTNGIDINPNTSISYSSIDFATANVGFVSGSNGKIYKTENGGASWTNCIYGYVEPEDISAGPGRDVNFCTFSVSCASVDTIYAVGTMSSGSMIIRSTDGGLSWREQMAFNDNLSRFFSISFPFSKIGYAVGAPGLAVRWNETESYSWSPSTGLSATNIANPIANPKTTTTYTLTRTTHNCTSTDNVTVYVEPSTGKYLTITCGGSVQLPSIPITSYTGIGKMRYKWTPSVGLDNDTIARPTTSATSDTKYVGTATLPSGAVIKDSINIYVRAINVDAGEDKTVVCGGTVEFDPLYTNYSGTGPLKYKWTPSIGLDNDSIPNPLATPPGDITYTVTVTTPGGCSSSDKVTVHTQQFQAQSSRYTKSITCGNSIQLDGVLTNYTGTGTLKYKWTPSTGLNNDTLATPTCSSTKSLTYRVTITTPNGCSCSTSVLLFVSSPTISVGTDKTVACGNSVQLDKVTANYTGAGKIRYKWSPSTGLNNDTIPNPIATVTSTTSYTVTVTTPAGCESTGVVKVNVTPATVDAGKYKTITCDATAKLDGVTTNYTGTGKLKYKWTPSIGLDNDTIASPTVTTTQNRTYTLTLTVPGGCTATDTVSVLYIPTNKPQITLVGINKANKNILSWGKNYSNAQEINIYKETNVSNSFTKIGSVHYDSVNSFVDTLSMPDVQSNKYKISILDRCGFESALSDYHKTMHLSINKGINTIWNLIWEAYEGYSVSTYNIYRGTTPANMQIIGSLSGSNTQFSDYTAPAGYVYYQIEAVSTSANGVKQQAKSSIKSAVETIYSSRSNIATNKTDIDGIFDLKDMSDVLSVYPNPASNYIQVTVGNNAANVLQLSIYNSQGQLVKTQNKLSNNGQIDLNRLTNGLYLVIVKYGEYVGKQRLLIQK